MTTEESQPNPAVIVMARVPRLGEGKTRLRSVLSDEACARLQEAFLRDALEVVLEAHLGPVYLAYTPAADAAWIEDEFGGCTIPFPQHGESLGRRMLAALHHVGARSYAPLFMIGTDTPLLQARHLQTALRTLFHDDLCLGPSSDGGYYLLACRTVMPWLLEGVPWGTDRVLDTTLRLAAESGLHYSLLETLYDIDTPENLVQLREDLAQLADDPSFRMPRHTLEALFC